MSHAPNHALDQAKSGPGRQQRAGGGTWGRGALIGEGAGEKPDARSVLLVPSPLSSPFLFFPDYQCSIFPVLVQVLSENEDAPRGGYLGLVQEFRFWPILGCLGG